MNQSINTKDNGVYTFFRNLMRSSFFFMHKSVTVLGKENLPKGEAFLITPNHQNAFMDAMVITFSIPKPYSFFLARADIFKNPFVGKVLNLVKMLPVYRIRDGKDSLQNNDIIFKKTASVIAQGSPLAIFPEGNHSGQRRFRAVKKGVIRTSFMALENFPEGKQLYIVPTGIEYNTSYEKVMQNIVVFYGKPICVNDFWELYQEDKARAERQLQLAIFDRMSDQMINIKSDDYYDFYDIVRESACGEWLKKKGLRRTPGDKLIAQIEIVEGLDKALAQDEMPFADLQTKARDYQKQLKDAKLRNWLFDKEYYAGGGLLLEIIVAIILFPVALYGRLTSVLPFAFANYKARKTKDPQWRSSIRFVLGFTLLPISHLLLACVTFFIFDHAWTYFAAVASFVISSKYSLRYAVWLKKIMGRLRYNKMRKQATPAFQKIVALRNDVNDFVLGTL